MDQGVDIHDTINAEWTNLVVRKRSFPPNIHLTEKAKELFFMVRYYIDAFRRFVFESRFLQRFPLDGKTLEEIHAQDVALLKFGMQWLKTVLFKPKDTEAATPSAQ